VACTLHQWSVSRHLHVNLAQTNSPGFDLQLHCISNQSASYNHVLITATVLLNVCDRNANLPHISAEYGYNAELPTDWTDDQPHCRCRWTPLGYSLQTLMPSLTQDGILATHTAIFGSSHGT